MFVVFSLVMYMLQWSGLIAARESLGNRRKEEMVTQIGKSGPLEDVDRQYKLLWCSIATFTAVRMILPTGLVQKRDNKSQCVLYANAMKCILCINYMSKGKGKRNPFFIVVTQAPGVLHLYLSPLLLRQPTELSDLGL